MTDALPVNSNNFSNTLLIFGSLFTIIYKVRYGTRSNSDNRFVFRNVSDNFIVTLLICGYSTSVVHELPKLRRRVRLPLSAYFFVFFIATVKYN